MTEKNKNKNKTSKEIEWIDLDDSSQNKNKTIRRPSEETEEDEKQGTRINFHIIFLSLILLVSATIAWKLLFWDKRVREDNEIEQDTSLNFDTEPLDLIVPLDSSNADKPEKDDDLRILFLGNGSLAEDKDSETNMANVVRAKTGATVYNCAIPDTYLTMKNRSYSSSFPYDAFGFYFMCVYLATDDTRYIEEAKKDLGGLSEEVQESLDLLLSIDRDQLDVLCIFYDASDYLEQHKVRSDNEPNSCTNMEGALRSRFELIKEKYPHIRIIFMSPTYAYAVDADGNYHSSYSTDILPTSLSDYILIQQLVCNEQRVSFVDNFYGSIYEDIADDYLIDNIRLNAKGNELVADRFIYALNRFNDYDFSAYEK